MKIKIIDQTNPTKLEIGVNAFIKDKRVIDIKYKVVELTSEWAFIAMVLYEDEPKNIKVKYFDECEYTDMSDTYARMSDAVNKFCSEHEVIKVDTTNNEDEELVTVVVYKEH